MYVSVCLVVCSAEDGHSAACFFLSHLAQDVENFGKKIGFTEENKKFVNVAMGQGQESTADAVCTSCSSPVGFFGGPHLCKYAWKVLVRFLYI